MRKLILWDLVSLEGYFEGAHAWDLGWHSHAWSDELERFILDQLRSSDLLLFGRVTYEGMARHWPDASGDTADLMNAVAKVVFSRTLASPTWHNTQLSRHDPVAHVAALKEDDGSAILVFGSARLAASLLEAGLVDEIRLAVAPVLLGAGQPLFKSLPGPRRLELLEAAPHPTGAVLLRYALAPAAA